MKAFVILAALAVVVYLLGPVVVVLISGVLLGVGLSVIAIMRFVIRATDHME